MPKKEKRESSVGGSFIGEPVPVGESKKRDEESDVSEEDEDDFQDHPFCSPAHSWSSKRWPAFSVRIGDQVRGDSKYKSKFRNFDMSIAEGQMYTVINPIGKDGGWVEVKNDETGKTVF